MIHSVAAVAGVALALITLPGTCELALLTFAGILRPRRSTPRAAGLKPPVARLAIVVPAHDEAFTIVRCVRSLAACDPPGHGVTASIVVIADNCIDATAELAQAAGARVIVRSDALRAGKGFALEDAFAILLGENFDAVIVVDADTIVESNLLLEIVALLDAGAEGVQARYGVLNWRASIRTRLMNVALMAFNVLRPRGRERLGLSVGILGNGFALSRATLEAVPYDAHSIVEDLEYHLRLVRDGRRIEFADRTTVRADMPSGGAGAETQRARWEGGRIRMIGDQAAGHAAEIFRGNIGLVEPLLELLLLPLAYQVVLLLVILAIPFAPVQIYALAGLALVGVHVAAAIVVGGGNIDDFAALAAAPFYVTWKLALSPFIFKMARHNTSWIRTER
jgi:cellulose synthase/poly-beta-1,6-N-acetylglucosamine synthase-like glycosyltransferase